MTTRRVPLVLLACGSFNPITNQHMRLFELARDHMHSTGPSPRLKLLCGADFLDTFKIPGLWRDDHVEELVGRFGLVCVSRGRLQPERAVHESDTLSSHRQNIFLVREWVRNETSATEVRRALRRGLSVKYLIPDTVIEYIHRHNLYTEDSERRNEGTVLRPLIKQAHTPMKSLDD
uniref:Nicotinamide/nicotinic acid mononucleotide adenylyltransferase 3 n=1 Tax=Amphiprion ocellaris TaxID=80972 RepID=A0AAQ5XUS4_AMPOC